MRKPQWINPEHLADRCAEIFEIYGVEIPENIYMDIHKFIMDFNKINYYDYNKCLLKVFLYDEFIVKIDSDCFFLYKSYAEHFRLANIMNI